MKFLSFLVSLFVTLLLSLPTYALFHRGHMLKGEVMPDHSYFLAVYDGPAVPTAAGQLPAANFTVGEIITGDMNRIEADAKTFSDEIHKLNRLAAGKRYEIPTSKGPGAQQATKAEPKRLRLESVYICQGTAELMHMPKPGAHLIMALGKRGWFYDLENPKEDAKLRDKLKGATDPSAKKKK